MSNSKQTQHTDLMSLFVEQNEFPYSIYEMTQINWKLFNQKQKKNETKTAKKINGPNQKRAYVNAQHCVFLLSRFLYIISFSIVINKNIH